MDFFQNYQQIIDQMIEFAEDNITKEAQQTIEVKSIIDELFPSFLQCSKNEQFKESIISLVSLVEAKNAKIKVPMYNNSLTCILNKKNIDNQSAQMQKNFELLKQGYLKSIKKEFSWVSIRAGSAQFNIPKIIKNGNHSLADIKLVLMITSKLLFATQVKLLLQKNQQQEYSITAEKQFKKQIEFLSQNFQQQSKIREVKLPKEQQEKFVRKIVNFEEYSIVCSQLNLTSDSAEKNRVQRVEESSLSEQNNSPLNEIDKYE